MGREPLRADIRPSCKIWGDNRRWNAKHWFEDGEHAGDLRSSIAHRWLRLFKALLSMTASLSPPSQ